MRKESPVARAEPAVPRRGAPALPNTSSQCPSRFTRFTSTPIPSGVRTSPAPRRPLDSTMPIAIGTLNQSRMRRYWPPRRTTSASTPNAATSRSVKGIASIIAAASAQAAKLETRSTRSASLQSPLPTARATRAAVPIVTAASTANATKCTCPAIDAAATALRPIVGSSREPSPATMMVLAKLTAAWSAKLSMVGPASGQMPSAAGRGGGSGGAPAGCGERTAALTRRTRSSARGCGARCDPRGPPW